MITVPTQLYIGLDARDDSDVPLGNATPYGTDKAFLQRKDTIDRWAVPKARWDGKGFSTPPAIEARLIDNVPTEGFQISKAVRNSGWNSGNVAWRIEDPRGYDLEISAANFAAIVASGSITKGKIKGACVWAREGAQNVLLPITSKPYKDMIKALARSTKNKNKKDNTCQNHVDTSN